MQETLITVTDTLRLDIINTSDQNWLSILIPFISAIAGGLIVLAGQWFERQHKNRLEIKNDIIDILAQYSANLLLLKHQLKELAMHKFHVQYWWHCHITTTDPEQKKHNYNKHLESQKLSFDLERKIYTTVSDFAKLQTKFETLIREKLPSGQFNYLEFEKAKTYDKTIPHEELRNELAEKDERELREKYFENLSNFSNAYSSMQEKFNKYYRNRLANS